MKSNIHQISTIFYERIMGETSSELKDKEHDLIFYHLKSFQTADARF